MLSAHRRAGLVAALAVMAGVVSIGVRPSAHTVTSPGITHLLGGTGWSVTHTDRSSWSGLPWTQWQLYDTHQHAATLYLEPSNAVKRVVHWTGELGYQGQGYVVLHRSEESIPLGSGQSAPATVAVVQHVRDRQLLLYAVVSPDGIAAHGTDTFFRTTWDTLRGANGPYYLVRVAVPALGGDSAARVVATRLLAPILPRLLAQIRTSAHSS